MSAVTTTTSELTRLAEAITKAEAKMQQLREAAVKLDPSLEKDRAEIARLNAEMVKTSSSADSMRLAMSQTSTTTGNLSGLLTSGAARFSVYAAAAAGVVTALTRMGTATVAAAVNAEQLQRANASMGAGFRQAGDAATAGTVGIRDQARALAELRQAGINPTIEQFAGLVAQARRTALALGTETPQELQRLVGAVREGGEGLRVYGLQTQGVTDKTVAANNALETMAQRLRESGVEARTMGETITAAGSEWDIFTSGLGRDISDLFGVKDALDAATGALRRFNRESETAAQQAAEAREQRSRETFTQTTLSYLPQEMRGDAAISARLGALPAGQRQQVTQIIQSLYRSSGGALTPDAAEVVRAMILGNQLPVGTLAGGWGTTGYREQATSSGLIARGYSQEQLDRARALGLMPATGGGGGGGGGRASSTPALSEEAMREQIRQYAEMLRDGAANMARATDANVAVALRAQTMIGTMLGEDQDRTGIGRFFISLMAQRANDATRRAEDASRASAGYTELLNDFQEHPEKYLNRETLAAYRRWQEEIRNNLTAQAEQQRRLAGRAGEPLDIQRLWQGIGASGQTAPPLVRMLEESVGRLGGRWTANPYAGLGYGLSMMAEGSGLGGQAPSIANFLMAATRAGESIETWNAPSFIQQGGVAGADAVGRLAIERLLSDQNVSESDRAFLMLQRDNPGFVSQLGSAIIRQGAGRLAERGYALTPAAGGTSEQNQAEVIQRASWMLYAMEQAQPRGEERRALAERYAGVRSGLARRRREMELLTTPEMRRVTGGGYEAVGPSMADQMEIIASQQQAVEYRMGDFGYQMRKQFSDSVPMETKAAGMLKSAYVDLSGGIVGALDQIISKHRDAGQVMQQLTKDILSSLGQRALSEGLYNLISGGINMAIPGMQAVGAAQLAGGGALVGLGTSLLAVGGAIPEVSAPAAAGGGAPSVPTAGSAGMREPAGEGGGTIIVNINAVDTDGAASAMDRWVERRRQLGYRSLRNMI